MNTRLIILLLLATIIVGCNREKPKFEKIKEGDTEESVLKSLGSPSSTAKKGPVKFLEYESWDYNAWWGYRENFQTFYVRIVDGKVESFGRKGDFDSTKDPTQKIIVETKPAEPAAKPAEAKSVRERLMEVDKLKADGVISDDEHKAMRKRIIDGG